MAFSKSILKKITTSENEKPDSPQITIANPLDADTFVNGIELILSPEFSKKGKLTIEINNIAEFSADDSEQFEGYAKYPIHLAKEFRRGEDIKVYAWNGTDTNEIKLSLNTSISKDSQPFNSQAVPLSKDVFNTVVSELEEVFEQRDYTDETVTQAIHTEGVKKLILMISESQADSAIVLRNPKVAADEDNVVDLDTSNNAEAIISSTGEVIVTDYGAIASRKMACQITNDFSIGLCTVELQTSEDDAIWTTRDSKITSPTESFTLEDSASRNVRYARLNISSVTTGSRLKIHEIYDSLQAGGSGDISFEVLNPSSQSFQTLIPSSDIGSVANGAAFTKQLGDVINDLASNKFNVILPSVQTQFRIKMMVTGSINVGVSIIRVQ